MNYRDILQLKTDVNTKVDGSSFVDSNESNTKIYEAFQNLLVEIRPESLRRVTTLKNAFSINNNIYKVPNDLERIEYVTVGNENDTLNDYKLKNVRSKNITDNIKTLEYGTKFVNGEQVIVIDDTYHNTASKTITSYDDLTDLTFINASNGEIEKDNAYKDSAIKFDMDIDKKEAYIYKTIIEPINVTDEVDGDLSFNLRLYLPDSRVIDSVLLEITDGTNSIELEEKDSLHSNNFEDGYNLINFRLNKNSEVDVDNITMATVAIKYNSKNEELTTEVSGLVIDELSVTNGHDIIISYISNSPFYNIESKVYNQEPVDDSDIIELDNSAYLILLNELSYILSYELQSEDGSFNRNIFESALYGNGKRAGLYKKYKATHRDSSELITEKYYSPKSNPNMWNNKNIV